jgi:pimeloyl-ACP methyl ester carboxylesterase
MHPGRHHLYDQLLRLRLNRHVVVVDFLGWGDSDKPTDHHRTTENQTDDLDAVIDCLDPGPLLSVPDPTRPVAFNVTEPDGGSSP